MISVNDLDNTLKDLKANEGTLEYNKIGNKANHNTNQALITLTQAMKELKMTMFTMQKKSKQHDLEEARENKK